jgi:protein ImuA
MSRLFKGLVMIEQLRSTIARMERPPGLEDASVAVLGIAEIDAVLGGGLGRGALHEIAAASEPHVAAASGFALGLTRSAPSRKSIVWIAETMAYLESGVPFGSGLDEFGLPPEQMLIVSVNKPLDLLWAMEEALHCRAVGAVIGELRHENIDAVALRRLSLAAAENSALALLLRASPSHAASTAATRWIVGAAPSQPRYGPGLPRINAQLVRNRRGPLGSWLLEWNEKDECFVLASTHPQPLATPPVDRQVGTLVRSIA